MARRGSTKALSVEQEEHVAKLFQGVRSASSGAASNDKGDVRAKHVLIECKMSKGTIAKPKKPPAWVKDFEKITYEAYQEGREPVLAFRFYDPESVLSDPSGYIDLTVRRAKEDAMRERDYEKAG